MTVKSHCTKSKISRKVFVFIFISFERWRHYEKYFAVFNDNMVFIMMQGFRLTQKFVGWSQVFWALWRTCTFSFYQKPFKKNSDEMISMHVHTDTVRLSCVFVCTMFWKKTQYSGSLVTETVVLVFCATYRI